MKAFKLAVVTAVAFAFLTGCMSQVPTDPKGITGGIAAAPRSLNLMLEDCDDNDNLNNWGGYWYAYDDAADGGASTIFPPKGSTFYMTYNGNQLPGSIYCAKFWGTTSGQFIHAFFGAGTTLGPDDSPLNLYALFGSGGFKFKARGASNLPDLDMFGSSSEPMAQFRCSFKVPWINPKLNSYPTVLFFVDSHWREYTFKMDDLGSAWSGGWDPSWTPANTMNMTTAIQFQTNKDGSAGEYGEIWIDDIQFFN